jgi:hypothetical protein
MGVELMCVQLVNSHYHKLSLLLYSLTLLNSFCAEPPDNGML